MGRARERATLVVAIVGDVLTAFVIDRIYGRALARHAGFARGKNTERRDQRPDAERKTGHGMYFFSNNWFSSFQ